ncbi:MAG: ATP synthase F1 subunit delta [Clostridia bacterium]|nr:ATP synthase F1 subunit delta [Clostridia bacterium]
MIDPREYGEALLMLAGETGSTEEILGQLDVISGALTEDPEYVRLLDTPSLPADRRLALLEEAFSGFDRNLLNLMKILCEKRSFYKLPAIAKSYSDLYDEKAGIERVTAVSAVALSDEQLSRLAGKLAAETGKKIVIRNVVDPKVLGGMRLEYRGIQKDGTLLSGLSRIEKALKSAKLP